jgi:hypothetical protein
VPSDYRIGRYGSDSDIVGVCRGSWLMGPLGLVGTMEMYFNVYENKNSKFPGLSAGAEIICVLR